MSNNNQYPRSLICGNCNKEFKVYSQNELERHQCVCFSFFCSNDCLKEHNIHAK